MKIPLEFFIDDFYEDKANALAIIEGRLMMGPIKLGDKFNFICKRTWRSEEDQEEVLSEISETNTFEGEVVRIFSFKRYLGELSQGYTVTVEIKMEPQFFHMMKKGMSLGFCPKDLLESAMGAS